MLLIFKNNYYKIFWIYDLMQKLDNENKRREEKYTD